MKISKKWRANKLARNLGKTDINVQCFVSKDGTIRQAFTHVCFGRTVCEERKQFIRNHNRYHPKNPITTLEVWQADNITNLFGNTTRADQILDIMNEWGLFRNCKVERFNKKQIPEGVRLDNWGARRSNLLRISFDVTTIKPQEVWIVGWVLRHLSAHPMAMLGFLKLLKLHPDKDSWQLFLVSPNIQFGKRFYEHFNGHLLNYSHCIALIKDVSIKEVQEELDNNNKYTTLMKSYNYNIEMGIAHRFAQLITGSIIYNKPSTPFDKPIYGINVRTNHSDYIYRHSSGERYSKDLVESFFSGEKFRERYITGKFKETKEYAFSFVR